MVHKTPDSGEVSYYLKTEGDELESIIVSMMDKQESMEIRMSKLESLMQGDGTKEKPGIGGAILLFGEKLSQLYKEVEVLKISQADTNRWRDKKDGFINGVTLVSGMVGSAIGFIATLLVEFFRKKGP